MTHDKFLRWLQTEMNKRGWSQGDLAKHAGISRAAITHVLNRTRMPGPDFCRAMARTLGYPQEYVFRLAGLITDPLPPGTDPETLALAQMLQGLDPADREEILALIQIKQARRAKAAGPPSSIRPRQRRSRAQNPAPGD